MLSIIIPTLNEEDHLGELLESIHKQDFDNYEIIVADAGSKDKTLEIAKKHNCRITRGGLPAKGRNEGAKIAKGSLILFLDADTILPEMVFAKVLREFKKRKLEIATFFLVPSGRKMMSKEVIGFTFLYNIPIFLMEKFLPHAAMGIMIKKKLFEKLNGFNEKITLAEDHDLARRAKKFGKFGILKSTKLYVSDRRFKKDGLLRTYSKYLLCEGHMIFIGPVEKNLFEYDFDRYSKNPKK